MTGRMVTETRDTRRTGCLCRNLPVADLIFLQCYLRSEERGRLMNVAIRLLERLNPDSHVLLIDNDSDLDPRDFLDWDVPLVGLDADDPVRFPKGLPRKTILQFPDSIGHMAPAYAAERPNPKDGPGRAIMTGLEIAMASGYRRASYHESDALLFLPNQWAWDRLRKPVGCQPRTPYGGFLDYQAWYIADLPWFRDFDFVGKYDWKTRGPNPCGEIVYEQILGDHMQVLPMRGGRMEGDMTEEKFRAVYADGIDFLTHTEKDVYAAALEMNGHADLVELL